MKIAALVGVKDDVELIRASVEHLWSIGVDLVIAYDDGSVDGTLSILSDLKSEERLWVVNVDRQEPRRYVISEAWRLEWSRKANADWVVFLDADEFLIPATGSLKECRDLEHADVLTINRFNMPLTAQGALVPKNLSPAGYADLVLCVQTLPDFHLFIQEHPNVPWILGTPIMAKALARPNLISTVTAGGHVVEARAGITLRHARPPDLLIAHMPFTTYERFERKVSNIAGIVQAFPEFFSGYIAWHWKRWAAMFEAGQLREEFERQAFSETLLMRMMDAGVLRTAAAILDQRNSQPGQEALSTSSLQQLLQGWFDRDE